VPIFTKSTFAISISFPVFTALAVKDELGAKLDLAVIESRLTALNGHPVVPAVRDERASTLIDG
jgi:hypothetical protein